MTEKNIYDEIAYPGFPFSQTHPDALAVLAMLAGMQPAPPAQCRVLELGCGNGANLIPMGYALPHSRFVGIDLAAAPIERGRRLVADCGLANVELAQMDVMDIGPAFGTFDYIIAHGLYSWVPPPVRAQVMRICSRNLAPHGVAYISYNANPGAMLRGIIRDAMLFHGRDAASGMDAVRKGLEMLGVMTSSPPRDNAYAALLRLEVERIGKRPLASLIHDELSADMHPFYFHEFAAHARAEGMQFLCEARQRGLPVSAEEPDIAAAWRGLGGEDPIAQEQYLDFLSLRMFRRSLLVHDGIAIDRSLHLTGPGRFRFAAWAQPLAPAPDLRTPGVAEQFRVSEIFDMSVDAPHTKAALAVLAGHWPESIDFDTLVDETRARLAPREVEREVDAHNIEAALAECYDAGVVDLRLAQPAVSRTPGPRPEASRVARVQAAHGEPVATILHTAFEVKDELIRTLIMRMDGTRDRGQLLAEVRAAAQAAAGTKLPPEISPQSLDMRIADLAGLGIIER
ncbi:MAG: methyltransferase regulatory domain-containing protein [Gammaproteobacteria bacterium]